MNDKGEGANNDAGDRFREEIKGWTNEEKENGKKAKDKEEASEGQETEKEEGMAGRRGDRRWMEDN